MRTRVSTKRLRCKRGGVLLDSMFGVLVLAFAAVSMYSLFPVVHKSHAISEQEQKATQIATKMLEHIQLLSPSKATAQTLTAMQLIDPDQTTAPYSFDRVPLDNAARYSPATALKNGTGVLAVEPIAGGSVRVTATVAWDSPSGRRSSTSLGTILGAYRP